MATDSRTPLPKHPGLFFYFTKAGLKLYGFTYDKAPNWQTGGRNQGKSQGYATIREALDERAEMRRKRKSRTTNEPSTEPLGAYLDTWIDSRRGEIRPNSIRHYRQMAKWFAPIAHVPLCQVTAAMIDRVYRDQVGAKPATVRVSHAVINTAMKAALRDRLLTFNPCVGVRLPKSDPATRKGWSLEEMRLFLAVTPDHPQWGPIWRLMLLTWLRPGEVMELRWSDIDLDTGTITVNRTLTMDEANHITTGPPKSRKSQRALPIGPDLIARLRGHRARQRETWLGEGIPWSTDTLVVAHQIADKVTRVGRGKLNQTLADLCRAAGVPVITPHGLRHTGSSVAYFNNVNEMLVSERMGHSSLAITVGTYVHSSDALHRAAAVEIEALIQS